MKSGSCYRVGRPALFPLFQLGIASLALAFWFGCAAPRSSLYSAETLPKKHWAVVGTAAANLPTQTTSAVFDGLNPLLDKMVADTTPQFTSDDMHRLVTALFAHSLDPVGFSPEIGFAYGLTNRWEAGYSHGTGTHIFHVKTQFLGPLSGDSSVTSDPWSGSVTVQGSQSTYELPTVFGLDKLQSILKYEFKRRDLLIPVTLGKPIGQQGRYGSFGLGVAAGMAWIEYGSQFFDVLEKLQDGSTRPFNDLHGSFHYPYYGGFFNARLGYRHVFVAGGLSTFWQDYGSFNFFGTQSQLSGWTFIPSLGLECTW